MAFRTAMRRVVVLTLLAACMPAEFRASCLARSGRARPRAPHATFSCREAEHFHRLFDLARCLTPAPKDGSELGTIGLATSSVLVARAYFGFTDSEVSWPTNPWIVRACFQVVLKPSSPRSPPSRPA